MTQTTRVHDYLSTYCWHEDHDDCRQKCKTCKRPCRCGCHRTEQTPTTPTVDPATGQPDGRMGGPVPHANRPAGWYRTMDRGFALGHFRFPAMPRRGERHTASDRSVWEFALTSTDWWELAEHAPQQDPAAAELDVARSECERLATELNERSRWEARATVRLKDLEAALKTAREMYTSARERAAGLSAPVRYVVVRTEQGDEPDVEFFDTAQAARTAEGIASGYAPPGVEYTAYALTDITEGRQ